MDKKKRQLLKEADIERLREYCVNDLNDMVDYRTGEIMSSREYERMPVEREDIGPTKPVLGSITSHAQMQRFMASKDRRKLILFNGCRDVYDMDKGKACFDKSRVIFPTNMLVKLSRLVERIDYMNTIVATPQELCTYLRTRHSNLHRSLSSLGHLVRVSGPNEGLQKGSIRVEVSPVYGFRHEASGLIYARRKEVETWYRSIAVSVAGSIEAHRDQRVC